MARGAMRNNMFSVMSHTGFGDMKIFRPDGVCLAIPRDQMKKSGTLKHTAAKNIGERITLENAVVLGQRGIAVTLGAV